MPTAPKLFGAIAFFMVGFFAAEMLKDSFEEGRDFGLFSVICGFIGVIIGWFSMGPSAGQGTGRAMAAGVRSSVLLVFYGTLAFSIREMVLRSVDRRYRGIQDALEGTFDIMIEYSWIWIGSGTTLIVLGVGGLLGGMFTNWAAVRWD